MEERIDNLEKHCEALQANLEAHTKELKNLRGMVFQAMKKKKDGFQEK